MKKNMKLALMLLLSLCLLWGVTLTAYADDSDVKGKAMEYEDLEEDYDDDSDDGDDCFDPNSTYTKWYSFTHFRDMDAWESGYGRAYYVVLEKATQSKGALIKLCCSACKKEKTFRGQKFSMNIKNYTTTYTGKPIKYVWDVHEVETTAEYDYTHSDGGLSDYDVNVEYYSDAKASKKLKAIPKEAGVYYVRLVTNGKSDILSKGMKSNIAKFTIKKGKQTLKTKVTTKTIKASALKKKAVSFSIGASAKGKLSYKVTKGGKSISVSKKGKVTLKKGAKKGTYKITVKAAANKNVIAASKTITIKVK